MKPQLFTDDDVWTQVETAPQLSNVNIFPMINIRYVRKTKSKGVICVK